MKTTAQTIILTILTVFVLTFCNNNTQKKTEQLFETVDSTTNLTTKNDNEADIIKNDIIFYPRDTNFIANLLKTGNFHNDAVWENADKGKWFGLFYNKHGFYIAEELITVSNRVARPANRT